MEIEHVKAELQALKDGNSTWEALKAVLSDNINRAAGLACKPDQKNGERQYNAGRLAAILEFEATLLNLRQPDQSG